MPRLREGRKPGAEDVGTTSTGPKTATLKKGRSGASNSIHIDFQVNSFFKGPPDPLPPSSKAQCLSCDRRLKKPLQVMRSLPSARVPGKRSDAGFNSPFHLIPLVRLE